jgi:hypothetical protein
MPTGTNSANKDRIADPKISQLLRESPGLVAIRGVAPPATSGPDAGATATRVFRSK